MSHKLQILIGAGLAAALIFAPSIPAQTGSCPPVDAVKLKADVPSTLNHFGRAVAVAGEGGVLAERVLITGHPFDDRDGREAGSVESFVYRLGDWWPLARWSAPRPNPDDWFGYSVALVRQGGPVHSPMADIVAVVGAPGDDEAGPDAGAAYVYRWDSMPGLWRLEKKLLPDPGHLGGHFGWSVDVRFPWIAVGAPSEDAEMGAAYLFRQIERPAPGAGGQRPQIAERWVRWQRVVRDRLVMGEREAGDQFGLDVAVLTGRTPNPVLAVAAPCAGPDERGAVMTFRRLLFGDLFEPEDLVQPEGLRAGDRFGTAVDLARSDKQGDFLLVGVPRDDGACPGVRTCDSGAVYLLRSRPPETASYRTPGLDARTPDRKGPSSGGSGTIPIGDAWELEEKFVASDSKASGWFGNAVQFGDGTFVVGAPCDDDLGAAYLFERDATTGDWTECSKLQAVDGQVGDETGFDVSISGKCTGSLFVPPEVIAVGAPKEHLIGPPESGAVILFHHEPDQNPVSLDVNPMLLSIGDTVQVSFTGGQGGGLLWLFLCGLDERPIHPWVSLAWVRLDAGGGFQVSGTVPPSLLGQWTLRAAGETASGGWAMSNRSPLLIRP